MRWQKLILMSNNKQLPYNIRLIETDSFPIDFLSAVAERESWRKEIYRPIYHVHKWWAKRLGSIFRGAVLGCLLPPDTDLQTAFYQKQAFSRTTIFDPFMGSGTTVGEAHKLGCIALGRDINPVACESVRVALDSVTRSDLESTFANISATVGLRIRELYKSYDDTGAVCDVLYFFWVKEVSCLHCSASVDLFSNRIVASNAYPKRKPEVQICCPGCGDIFPSLHHSKEAKCRSCGLEFNPHSGAAHGAKATCPQCSGTFSIADAVRAYGKPPRHKLYGKLVLTQGGEKQYLAATAEDQTAYKNCSELLKEELARGTIRLPDMCLADGFNTRQAMGYNYRAWRDFFNDRQLLALGWLQEGIAQVSNESVRDTLFTLFSGVLEFNNLFASYKGEGTGAVRHMFAHHILKPERTPIEANVWGTPKSSGSFSTLFKTRLLRALDYKAAPFEAQSGDTGKAFDCSEPFSDHVGTSWPIDGNLAPRGIYLSCGSSDKTDLPSGSVDYVVTDPPFFDNVHYSELADFFYAWESLYPRGFITPGETTRQAREVQDTDANAFSEKLRAVFGECHRVLKNNGLLVFSYHHSRTEGWSSLVDAVMGAGFSIVNAHPLKSEMSVAAPKSQAKEPIQLDIVLVCRKHDQDQRPIADPIDALTIANQKAARKIAKLESIGLSLSKNDRRITLISQFIAELGPVGSAEDIVEALEIYNTKLNEESMAHGVSSHNVDERQVVSTY
jgi:putative DNA methylase